MRREAKIFLKSERVNVCSRDFREVQVLNAHVVTDRANAREVNITVPVRSVNSNIGVVLVLSTLNRYSEKTDALPAKTSTSIAIGSRTLSVYESQRSKDGVSFNTLEFALLKALAFHSFFYFFFAYSHYESCKVFEKLCFAIIRQFRLHCLC